MKTMKKLLIAIISIVILLTSCASQNTSTEITSLDDLREGKRRIGVSSVTDEYIEDQLAYTLIKNSVDKFTYIHNPEASLVNRVEIVIKE